MATDLTEIQLDRKQRQRIAALAAATGKHWKTVLTEAIRAYLPEENGVPSHSNAGESALELAQRLGIVGSLKNAPSDLSTNPKYLEGMGQSD